MSKEEMLKAIRGNLWNWYTEPQPLVTGDDTQNWITDEVKDITPATRMPLPIAFRLRLLSDDILFFVQEHPTVRDRNGVVNEHQRTNRAEEL